MDFTKMHGCGNDYVVVDDREESIRNPEELSRKLSNRNYGVGSDGLLLIRNSVKADYTMRMYNSDGSEGEMCGNGIRCVSKYIYDNGLSKKEELEIETKAGILDVKLHIMDQKADLVTVNMGSPITKAASIPVLSNMETVMEESFTVNGEQYDITCIGMGNPHAILFVRDMEDVDVIKLGILIERHERFPNRTNVEFVQILSENEIRMKVWERGSGLTLACGTGACASVAASVLTGRTNDEVAVHLDGGTLTIKYDRIQEEIWMTGPAKEVFTGRYEAT